MLDGNSAAELLHDQAPSARADASASHPKPDPFFTEIETVTAMRMADHRKSCELAKQLKKEGIVVATTCVARHWGTSWYAWNDRTWPDGPQGHGKTEVEAIENLVEQLAEAMDRAGS